MKMFLIFLDSQSIISDTCSYQVKNQAESYTGSDSANSESILAEPRVTQLNI